jgi:hypothetical protein
MGDVITIIAGISACVPCLPCTSAPGELVRHGFADAVKSHTKSDIAHRLGDPSRQEWKETSGRVSAMFLPRVHEHTLCCVWRCSVAYVPSRSETISSSVWRARTYWLTSERSVVRSGCLAVAGRSHSVAAPRRPWPRGRATRGSPATVRLAAVRFASRCAISGFVSLGQKITTCIIAHRPIRLASRERVVQPVVERHVVGGRAHGSHRPALPVGRWMGVW